MEKLAKWFFIRLVSLLMEYTSKKAHLTEKANAFNSVNFLEEKFPVVLYAPSYQASSIEILPNSNT